MSRSAHLRSLCFFHSFGPRLRLVTVGTVLVFGASSVAVADPAAASVAPRVVVASAAAPVAVTERPDAVSAMLAARRQGSRVEDLSSRTETTQVFANPGGTLSMEASARPVRVRRTDGSWVPVDTALTVATDGSVQPGATTVGLRFSGGAGPLAEISDAGRSLAVAWREQLPAPLLVGNTATYVEVLHGEQPGEGV